MNLKKRGNLTINGYGAANGGSFQRVRINGKGTINDQIDCVEFDCNGSGTVKGNIKADKAKIKGRAKMEGKLEADVLTVDGTAKMTDDVVTKKLEISGHAAIGGRVKAEEVRVKGILKVAKDCETEIFKAESQFIIGGLLNAEHIEIQIYGECTAKEIGCQTIKVKQKSSFIGSLLKPFAKTQLEADCIEGENIELENTIAKIVRGNDVRIGPNCQIDVVEYSGEFIQDKKSIVRETKKA